MKSKWIRALPLILLVLTALTGAEQTAELKSQIFSEAEQARQAARDANADLLAPDNFARAARFYSAAESKFEREKTLESINKDLAEAVQYFQQAVKASRLAAVTLDSLIRTRNDAIRAEANRYAPELWADAEQRFADAAGKLEDGNINAARKRAGVADEEFRNAELVAIKNQHLSDARRLLERAEDQKVAKLAPATLQSGREWLEKADRALDNDRYNTREAIELASRAGYDISHALYLNDRLLPVKRGDVSLEELALQIEQPLVEIGKALDMQLAFDSGLQAPTRAIVNQVKGLREDSLALGVTREEVAHLENELNRLQQRLGTQSDRISQQEENNRRLQQIEALFDDHEATVYRQGGNVLLRLVGLNFDSGKATIPQQYFSILSKVMQAVRLFPGASLMVEGHTDSFGSELMNVNLSQLRADAVAEYLRVNISDASVVSIRAIGYGESRPVANNETAEGRKSNRRIDLLIKPAFQGQ